MRAGMCRIGFFMSVFSHFVPDNAQFGLAHRASQTSGRFRVQVRGGLGVGPFRVQVRGGAGLGRF